MSATVRIDDVRFRDALNRLASLGLQTGRVLKVETRQVLREIIKRTPPENRPQGQMAVKTDLAKMFMPVEGKILTAGKRFQKKRHVKKHGTSDFPLVVLWTTSGGNVFGVEEHNFKRGITEQEMEQLHNERKNDRGRVRGMGPRVQNLKGNIKKINRIVVPRVIFRRYQRRIVSHVGKLKGGWAVAAAHIGIPVPSWASRHANSHQGYVVDNLVKGPSPSITIGNISKGARSKTEASVKRALHNRAIKIKLNVKRMLKHGPGASGDFGYGN